LRSEPYRNTEVKVAVNQVKLDPTAIGEEREKAGLRDRSPIAWLGECPARRCGRPPACDAKVTARESRGSEGRIQAARFPSRNSLEKFGFDRQRSLKRDTITHGSPMDKQDRGWRSDPATGSSRLGPWTRRVEHSVYDPRDRVS
jgi:hypothetical protein